MREPVIREISMPPKAESAVQIRLVSLAAAVRSLKPHSPPDGKPPKPKRRWQWAIAAGALTGVSMAVFSQETPEPWVVSGSPDLKHTSDGKVVRWHTSKLDLTIDPSLEALGPRARDVVLLGFDAWHTEHPELPDTTFDLTSTSRKAERDGVNLVTYEEIDRPGFKNALAITIAYSEPNSGKIVEVDIVINARQDFAVLEADPATNEGKASDSAHAQGEGHHHQAHGCLRDYDLQSVVAHEVGHFFGLGEDKHEQDATMYFKTARCDIRQRDLVETDVEAVRSVYSEPLDSETDELASTAACATRPGRGSATPWFTTLLTGLGLLGLSLRRRRGAR